MFSIFFHTRRRTKHLKVANRGLNMLTLVVVCIFFRWINHRRLLIWRLTYPCNDPKTCCMRRWKDFVERGRCQTSSKIYRFKQTECRTTEDNPAPWASVLREAARHISMAFFFLMGRSQECAESCGGKIVCFVVLFCYCCPKILTATCLPLRRSVDWSTQTHRHSSPPSSTTWSHTRTHCRTQKQSNHIKASGSIFQHHTVIS